MIIIIIITIIIINEDLQRVKKFNPGGRIQPLSKIFNECRSLTGVEELNPPLLKIFNACRSLTGVGELNPIIEDLQRVKRFNAGGRIEPLLKIFNECRSLTGVEELNPPLL